MKVPAYFVLVASTILIAACGSGASANSPAIASPTVAGTPANAASVVGPCALVTVAEASSAAGRNVANLVNLGAPPVPGVCAYGVKRTTATVFVYMQTYHNVATAHAVTVGDFQSAVSSAIGQSSTDSKELSGIGDRAYAFGVKNGSSAGIAIIVFKGNVVFLVAVDPTSSSSAVETLARTAASRIH